MFIRKRESRKATSLILHETDMPKSIIRKAMSLTPRNPYHNADHAISATKAAVMIGKAEKLSRQKINYLALVMLFHDTRHTGIATVVDEMRSVKTALKNISTEVLELCRENPFQKLENILRDGILATCFSARGKYCDPLIKIIQDADIHPAGISANYWLYMTLGLAEEFAKQFSRPDLLNPHFFLQGKEKSVERGFVSFLEMASGDKNIFLSEGAKKIWHGNAGEILAEIEQLSHKKVEMAFVLRNQDITFEEFEKEMANENETANE